ALLPRFGTVPDAGAGPGVFDPGAGGRVHRRAARRGRSPAPRLDLEGDEGAGETAVVGEREAESGGVLAAGTRLAPAGGPQSLQEPIVDSAERAIGHDQNH